MHNQKQQLVKCCESSRAITRRISNLHPYGARKRQVGRRREQSHQQRRQAAIIIARTVSGWWCFQRELARRIAQRKEQEESKRRRAAAITLTRAFSFWRFQCILKQKIAARKEKQIRAITMFGDTSCPSHRLVLERSIFYDGRTQLEEKRQAAAIVVTRAVSHFFFQRTIERKVENRRRQQREEKQRILAHHIAARRRMIQRQQEQELTENPLIGKRPSLRVKVSHQGPEEIEAALVIGRAITRFRYQRVLNRKIASARIILRALAHVRFQRELNRRIEDRRQRDLEYQAAVDEAVAKIIARPLAYEYARSTVIMRLQRQKQAREQAAAALMKRVVAIQRDIAPVKRPSSNTAGTDDDKNKKTYPQEQQDCLEDMEIQQQDFSTFATQTSFKFQVERQRNDQLKTQAKQRLRRKANFVLRRLQKNRSLLDKETE